MISPNTQITYKELKEKLLTALLPKITNKGSLYQVPAYFKNGYKQVHENVGTGTPAHAINTYRYGTIIKESISASWTVSQDKSTWYHVISARTDGGVISIVIPNNASTITNDMVHFTVGINNFANTAYPGNNIWLPAVCEKESTGKNLVWKDQNKLRVYNKMSREDIINKNYNGGKFSKASYKYSATCDKNCVSLIIYDETGLFPKKVAEFKNISGKSVSIENVAGASCTFILEEASQITKVEESTIIGEFDNYLRKNNLNALENTIMTSKSMIAFWNSAASFFSAKLCHAVSMFTHERPLVYISDDRVREISTLISRSKNPIKQSFDESDRLVNNIPLSEISGDPNTSSNITNEDVDAALNQLLTQINSSTRIKTMIYEFNLKSSSSCSSSSSSSCSSSSSSSMFIAYMKV
jgi:hypothetical protein